MAYTKQTWADLPSKTTPINATRLTHIEDGIFNAAQTADTAASTAGTAAANIGIVSSRVETLTERVNGLDTTVSNKVDKVAGKGLSTNDYDNTDKSKVDNLGTASTKNAISVVTDSSDLVESGAVKDIVGWGNKNLLDKSALQIGGLNDSGQEVENEYLRRSPFIAVNGDNVTLTVYNATDTNRIGFYKYNANKEFIEKTVPSTYPVVGQDYSVTISITGVSYIRIQSAIPNVTDCNVQIELGTTATSYEPYHASVKDTLRDAEVIEGKNLIGWKIGYVYSSTDGSLSPNTHGVCSDKIKVISGQKFIGSKKNTLGSNDSMYARTYDANGAFVGTITVLTNTQLRNEITIPANIGYIGVFQLLNSANVSREWLDSNEIMFYDASETDPTFEPYYTPLKDVVPNKADNSVIAPVENSPTASKDYAVGDYFIKDTILGKTKAPIASGGTFTKDTNYEETDVAKELTELYKYIGILTTPVEAFTANSLPILKRNITNAFYNGSLRGEIAAGNFKNVRPGDYIIGQATGSTYYVAECDYWLGNGDSTNGTTYPAYNTHHLGLMLFKPVGTTALWRGYGYSDKSWRASAEDLGRCPWNAGTTVDPTDTEAIGSNSTNITRSYNGTNMSAYMGSFIRERIDAILLPQCFQADFGFANVLKRRNWLSNAINASAASGARSDWQGIASSSVWVDRFIDLASEVELYGSRINSSSCDDIGVQNKQLPIYRNGRIHDFYPRMDLWTKGCASAAIAASRGVNGVAGTYGASGALWACPLGCVK